MKPSTRRWISSEVSRPLSRFVMIQSTTLVGSGAAADGAGMAGPDRRALLVFARWAAPARAGRGPRRPSAHLAKACGGWLSYADARRDVGARSRLTGKDGQTESDFES